MSHMGQVYLSHGLESGPKARKVQALATIARARGWDTVIPDYRGLGLEDRVSLLLAKLESRRDPVLLVGSSMGGAVSILATVQKPVAGLFLLAPAVFLPGYDEVGSTVQAQRTCIVHGWNDDVIPAKNAFRLAERHSAALHLYDDDHRLSASLAAIQNLFERWLSLDDS